MTLGDDIRQARERAQLTQPELAELVGVSEGTISNWERGKVRAPKNRLARVWEVLHAYRAPRPGRDLPTAETEFDPDAIVGHLTTEQMAAVAARLPDHIFADEIAHRLRRTTDPHLPVPSRTWSADAIPADPSTDQAEKPSGSTGEQPA